MQFQPDPIPHAEAVKLIADKPAVTREIFDQLLQEHKGRAFTISGIEAFDVMQSVQDKIAALPAGADWKKLRKQIAAEISPWLGEEEGLRRAKLLLNHHGRAAYAATNARVIHAQADVFTHLMYRSSRTSKESRKSHQALDGMIFPTKHPFWETHTPPWEFGCNCMDPIPLTQEDADEAPPAKVASPAQLAALEKGNFVSGNNVFNIQTPREQSGGAAGYEWSWRDTTLPYGEIKKRWTPDVAEAFEEWAGKQDIGGVSLFEMLTENTHFREAKMPAAGGGEARFVDLARGSVFSKAFTSGGTPGLVARMAAPDAEKVTAFEARHADKRIEHGLAFDKKGNTLWEDVGKADSIHVPKRVDLEGMGFTHNHPEGSSFSLEDVEALFARRVGEIRVATSHGLFSVRRIPGVSHSKVEIRTKELAPDIRASLRAIEGEADFDTNRYWDTLWRALASEGLIDYDYTPMDKRPRNPISEALSAARRARKRKREEYTTLRTPSSAEMRDYLDGKIELPGLDSFSKTLRRLSIEEGEPQP